MSLLTREYKTISYISGPLIFLQRVSRAALGEMVSILLPGGERRRGQVIEISDSHAVIQVLETTAGIGHSDAVIRFEETTACMGLSPEILGRRFNGAGDPLDGLPPLVPHKRVDINGAPINPASRLNPDEFVQTGISAIDGLNTLVRGQKLPIFSGAGLPANELAAQILKQARVLGKEERFAVVFAAMGITFRDAAYFIEEIDRSGAMERSVLFLNLSSDPTIERLLTPRFALACAEYLAFELDMQVLVILTDMTSYCEALREISTAREEIPGRRGYPGYMYTDLATLYERAGRIEGKRGSVTQLSILTVPDDDITHPVPDLTGYITEGQIVLSRDLHRKGISPPIDVLPSLSRLMNRGIGPGRTREDHRELADQLYALYATGRDIRKMEAIVGEMGLSETERRIMRFADSFEKEFVCQGEMARDITETLDLGWALLRGIPRERLSRIRTELLDRYGTGKVSATT